MKFDFRGFGSNLAVFERWRWDGYFDGGSGFELWGDGMESTVSLVEVEVPIS